MNGMPAKRARESKEERGKRDHHGRTALHGLVGSLVLNTIRMTAVARPHMPGCAFIGAFPIIPVPDTCDKDAVL